MGKNVVKLKDIANVLNVSVNTVSRALRDGDDISDEVKEKVKKLAKEMGYIPNRLSDYIREGKSNLIGLVIPSISNPYYILADNEIISILQSHGFYPLIVVSKCNVFDYELLIKLMNNRVCAIVSFAEISNDVFNFCKSNGLPLISVGVTPLNKEIDAVFNDDYHSGKLVAEEFNNSGASKPCYINTDMGSVNKFRRKGFLENVKDHQVDEYYFVYSDRAKYKEEIIKSIVNNKNDFIYSFNDEIANFIIDALNEVNYTSYEIFGTDGIPKFFPYSTRFNTVGYSFEKIAQLVMDIILKRINDEEVEPIQIKYKGKVYRFKREK